MRSFSTFALAACLVAWAAPIVAQQSVDYASVSGRVTDPSGAVVPGAQVTARHTHTNVTAATVTDQDVAKANDGRRRARERTASVIKPGTILVLPTSPSIAPLATSTYQT